MSRACFTAYLVSTMKCLIILHLLFIITSADKRCHGIYFHDRYYNVDIIKDGINNLHEMAYNMNDNTIYFTFDQISDRPTRVLGYINLDTNVANVIDGIRNATAVAIDESRNRIYVGGSDGLFMVNDKKVPVRLPVEDDIRHMHYKNGLIYFTNRRREAYKFEDGFAVPLPELQGQAVDNLILDDDNNFFLLQKDNLFRIKMGTRALNIHEKQKVTAIATNMHSKAYVSSNNGVFVYNKYKFVLDKVADLKNLKALTFNRRNEPIYAVNDLIIKLSLNDLPCFEH